MGADAQGGALELSLRLILPGAAADFGYTWERFGYWRAKAWEAGLRGVGGAGGVIVSGRARELLESCRVRHVEYVPVSFVEGRGSTTETG